MRAKANSPCLKKKMISRWGVGVLLAGFVLGTFLPSLVQAAPRRATTLDVVINEVAWMGTGASGNDEWIELYNPTGSDIDLDQWEILADDGAPSITINIGDCKGGNCIIPAGGFFLLERTDDSTISDIDADLIYTGSLENLTDASSEEVLRLLDNTGFEIDTANLVTKTDWPAGDNTTKASMERIAVIPDSPTAWSTNNGITVNGLDAASNPLQATPKQVNSFTYQPLSIIINEVAWAGTEAYFGDEWIELYNPSAYAISVDGWRLASDSANVDFFISGTIASGGYLLLERKDSSVTSANGQIYDSGLLDDTGETLRLLAPDRTVIDTANGNGGAWSHGRLSPASSMERINATADADDNWVTNDSRHTSIKDAGGNYVYGTPGEANWGNGVAYTFTPTITSSPVPTNTPIPSPTPTSPVSLTVLINEVAWYGTDASSYDEWIELYNNSSVDIDLTGWTLKAYDGEPSITFSSAVCQSITAPCVILAGEYFLLERSDDTTVSTEFADVIYTGTLEDGGEYLQLISPSGKVVDTANKANGYWPAGDKVTVASMERSGVVADSYSAWFSHAGSKYASDANGEPINGTPRQANWSYSVTATPSPIPTKTPISPTRTPTPYPFQSVVLNEVLPRPGHDWNQDGVVDVNDEFVEIINRGVSSVSLSGWRIEDLDTSYKLPEVSLGAGERIAIYGFTSHISLSDGGDTVRLLLSNGQVSDVVTYTVVKAADESWCRLPENGFWNPKCFPTPNEENAGVGDFPPITDDVIRNSCFVPDTAPANILSIECGLLGMRIYDGEFWGVDNRPVYWLTGHSKYSTWFR